MAEFAPARGSGLNPIADAGSRADTPDARRARGVVLERRTGVELLDEAKVVECGRYEQELGIVIDVLDVSEGGPNHPSRADRPPTMDRAGSARWLSDGVERVRPTPTRMTAMPAIAVRPTVSSSTTAPSTTATTGMR